MPSKTICRTLTRHLPHDDIRRIDDDPGNVEPRFRKFLGYWNKGADLSDEGLDDSRMRNASWESTAWVLGRIYGPVERGTARKIYNALRQQKKAKLAQTKARKESLSARSRAKESLRRL